MRQPRGAFFQQYGAGANINGPILTRGEVSSILGTAVGAFNSLPAGTPVFGQVQKLLPTDAGGGDPVIRRLVSRIDYSLSNNTQLYIRYAYQNQEAEPGTNASSAYDGYDTGYHQESQRTGIADACVYANVHVAEQGGLEPAAAGSADQRRPAANALHEPTTTVRLQNYRITFPGYLPWGP